MKRPGAVSAVASLLIAAAGLAAIGLLFELRFAAGDVYPRYSSLRSDPVGVRALYDSLARLPGGTCPDEGYSDVRTVPPARSQEVTSYNVAMLRSRRSSTAARTVPVTLAGASGVVGPRIAVG